MHSGVPQVWPSGNAICPLLWLREAVPPDGAAPWGEVGATRSDNGATPRGRPGPTPTLNSRSRNLGRQGSEAKHFDFI